MIDRFRRDLERIFEVGILIIDFLEFSRTDMRIVSSVDNGNLYYG